MDIGQNGESQWLQERGNRYFMAEASGSFPVDFSGALG